MCCVLNIINASTSTNVIFKLEFHVFNFVGFLCVSGVVVVLVTILLAIFKKEKDNRLEDGYVKINVFQNYKLLWDILKLPHIQILAIALLTARVIITNYTIGYKYNV